MIIVRPLLRVLLNRMLCLYADYRAFSAEYDYYCSTKIRRTKL